MLLEGFRTHKRWLMFIAMVLIIPSFVVTGIYSYNRMISDDGAIAKVDDESILPMQFDEAKRKQLETLRQQLGENFRANMLENQNAKALILQNVLTEQSVMNEAAMENVEISEASAIELIKTFPAFQEGGKFSKTRYSNYLQSVGQSDEYFVYKIRQDLKKQLLHGGIIGTAFVPTTLIDSIDKLLTEKRTTTLYRVKAETFLTKVNVTEAEAKAFWDKNQKAFELPDEMDVQYVVLTPDLFKTAKPSEEDIQTFYQQNPNRFKENEARSASHILIRFDNDKEKARSLAEKLLAQVKADPKKFPDIAKEYSKDPGSAKSGGSLGFFGRGQMVEPFEKAVFNAQKGEIVGLVETNFGYHIIHVTDIRPAYIRPLAEVKDEIIELYAEQEAQKKFAEEAEAFTNIAYEQSDSLDPLVEKYKIQAKTVKNVLSTGVNDPEHKQYLNVNVLEALFSDECAKEKRNTQAIEVRQNTLVAARVLHYRPSHIETFKDSKDRIEQLLKHNKALDLAKEEGEKQLVALKKDGKAEGVTFDKEITVSRSNPSGQSFHVVGEVLRVPAQTLPAYVGVLDNDAYVIAHVLKSEVRKPDEKTYKSEQAEISRMLGFSDDLSYNAALRTKHKATVINKDYMFEKTEK